eukprot:311075-Amphidinium_carterae.1
MIPPNFSNIPKPRQHHWPAALTLYSIYLNVYNHVLSVANRKASVLILTYLEPALQGATLHPIKSSQENNST